MNVINGIRKIYGRDRAIVTILVVAAVIFAARFTYRHFTYVRPALQLAESQVKAEMLVTDYPSETIYGYQIPVKAFGVNVLLYVSAPPDTRPGDTITALVNLGVSNNRAYTLKATQAGNVTITPADRVPLTLFPARMRNELLSRIYRLFGESSAAFAAALALGDSSGFSTTFTTALSTIGLSHTVAVSGMHISFIVGVFAWMFGGIRRAAPITIPVIILFTAIVGFPPSAVRSCVMSVLMLTALLIKRDYDSRVALALALAIILAVSPEAVFDVGLQLSFLATLGIILFAEPWGRPFINKLRVPFARGAIRTLSTTAAALVFTVPLVAYYFGVVSLIAPLANLIVLPVIPPLFIGTLAVVGLSYIYMPAASIAANILGFVYQAIEWVITLAARFPLSAIYTNDVLTTVMLVMQYTLIIVCYLSWRRGERRFVIHACAAVCSFCIVVLGGALYNDFADTMRFTAVDVGQGQGLILGTKGRTVIIDCGGSYAEYAMPAAVLSTGAPAIDAIILTHLHADHTNGVVTLLERVKVGAVIMYDDTGEEVAAIRDEIERAAAGAGTQVLAVTRDMVIEMQDCRLHLYVSRDDSSVNERCMAVAAVYKGFTLLVTGDLNSESERRLLRFADIPVLDLLVAGHHGSKYSTSETLLHYTKPQAAVISVGVNSYGHPTPEVLGRLNDIGAKVYRTDAHGSITVTVN